MAQRRGLLKSAPYRKRKMMVFDSGSGAGIFSGKAPERSVFKIGHGEEWPVLKGGKFGTFFAANLI